MISYAKQLKFRATLVVMDDLISTFRRGLAAQTANEVSAVLSHRRVTLNKLLCWPCWICESLC